MTPKPSTDLLEAVKRFLANPGLRKLLRSGELDGFEKRFSQVDKAIHETGVSTDADRATLFYVLFNRDSHNLDLEQVTNRRFNGLLLLKDFEVYAKFFLRKTNWFRAGGYQIRSGPNLKKEFNANISIGLKQSYARAKGYLANNHLIGRFLREPDFLLKDIRRRLDDLDELGFELPEVPSLVVFLENRMASGTKIDDLHVRFLPDNFRINLGGVEYDLSHVVEYIRISVDSKFYINPNNISSGKTLYQQSALTIGDRMGQVYDIVRALENTTDGEFDTAIEKLLPLLFHHYIVIPPDVGIKSDPLGISKKVRDELATEVISDFESHLNDWVTDLGFEPAGRVDKIKEVAEDFFLQHFGEGDFILKHELRYDDVRTP